MATLNRKVEIATEDDARAYFQPCAGDADVAEQIKAYLDIRGAKIDGDGDVWVYGATTGHWLWGKQLIDLARRMQADE